MHDALAKTTEPEDVLSLNNITVPHAYKAFARFSLGLWLTLLSIVGALATGSYYAGKNGTLDGIFGGG